MDNGHILVFSFLVLNLFRVSREYKMTEMDRSKVWHSGAWRTLEGVERRRLAERERYKRNKAVKRNAKRIRSKERYWNDEEWREKKLETDRRYYRANQDEVRKRKRISKIKEKWGSLYEEILLINKINRRSRHA